MRKIKTFNEHTNYLNPTEYRIENNDDEYSFILMGEEILLTPIQMEEIESSLPTLRIEKSEGNKYHFLLKDDNVTSNNWQEVALSPEQREEIESCLNAEEYTTESLFNYPKKTGDSLMDFITDVETKFTKFLADIKSASLKEVKNDSKKKGYNEESNESFKKMYMEKALQQMKLLITKEEKSLNHINK